MQVQCNGATGQWEKGGEADGKYADYQEVIEVKEGEDQTIKEHRCTAEGSSRLVVTLGDAAMGAGATLVCDTLDGDDEPSTFTILAPNTCLLLCDLHLGMTIRATLSMETGEFQFRIEELEVEGDPTSGIITQDNVDENLKCWGV